MKTRSVVTALVGLCLGVLTLGSCAKSGDPDGGPGSGTSGAIGASDLYQDSTGEAASPSTPATSATSEPDPFDEFRADNAVSNDIVNRVEVEFLANCMRSSGFDFTIPDPRPEVSINPEDGHFLDQWWGVRSARFAGDYGYRNAPLPANESDNDADSDGWDDLDGKPDGYADALLGPDHDWANPGGCLGEYEARRDQGRVLTLDETTAIWDELDGKAYSAALASATMAEATSAWSTCMAERGHTYNDPNAAKADFMVTTVLADGATDSVPKTEQATEQEKLVATADAECKDQTDFWAVWNKTVNQARAELIETYRPQLEKIKQDAIKYNENINALITELSL